MPKPVRKSSKRLSPVPGGKKKRPRPLSQDSRDRRARRDFEGYAGPAAKVARFPKRFIVLPDETLLIIGAWVIAAWFSDLWDRFPHLAVNSPEKRCGKTRLLQLLELVTPNPCNTSNISPAAVYRLIESKRPTLLLDEAQSMTRRGSESSEVIRELFNAGIDRSSQVIRMGGKGHTEVQRFSVYSPKVIALIGELDGVLGDRCLPVSLKRKTNGDAAENYRSRVVEPEGKVLADEIEKWIETNKERIGQVYDHLEPFTIQNDRMAELLVPLQAVLSDFPEQLEVLQSYAMKLDQRDREAESKSPGILLLTACREIFAGVRGTATDGKFIPTASLIDQLSHREEESWGTFTRGGQITPEALSRLLKPYGIRSQRNRKQTARGYYELAFIDSWQRYIPETPSRSLSGYGGMIKL